jgi:hypothetical protein
MTSLNSSLLEDMWALDAGLVQTDEPIKTAFDIEEGHLALSRKDVIDGRVKMNWGRFFKVFLIHISTFLGFGPQLTGLIVMMIYGKFYGINL